MSSYSRQEKNILFLYKIECNEEEAVTLLIFYNKKAKAY